MKIVLISAVFIALICALWILQSSTTAFHRQILKQEATFRADVLQRINILHQQRDSLDAIIVNLKQDIKAQTAELKNQIQKIKITYVPAINYTNYSDTALVKRLLSDYPNR